MKTDPVWTDEKWNQTIAALMRRASTDAAFRQKCLADARAALKEVAGIEPALKGPVRFIEPSAGVVFTLPPLQGGANGELSDAALESVAGGDGGSHIMTCGNIYCR